MDKLLTRQKVMNLKPNKRVAKMVRTAIIRKNETENFCFSAILFDDVDVFFLGPEMIILNMGVSSKKYSAGFGKWKA